MTETRSSAAFLGRRGELLAEIFLQGLEPTFLNRPTHDVGYDFFVGFKNSEGGLNTYGVEVKATERAVSSSFVITTHTYRRLISSNFPGLLLVVQVKQNVLFYALPQSDCNVISGNKTVTVPVTEINEKTILSLRKRLTKAPQMQS